MELEYFWNFEIDEIGVRLWERCELHTLSGEVLIRCQAAIMPCLDGDGIAFCERGAGDGGGEEGSGGEDELHVDRFV